MSKRYTAAFYSSTSCKTLFFLQTTSHFYYNCKLQSFRENKPLKSTITWCVKMWKNWRGATLPWPILKVWTVTLMQFSKLLPENKSYHAGKWQCQKININPFFNNTYQPPKSNFDVIEWSPKTWEGGGRLIYHPLIHPCNCNVQHNW